MRIKDLLKENVKIDQREGWGAVPNNVDIDYYGIKVKMRPTTFLNLVSGRPEDTTEMEAHIRSGGSIGSPFLEVMLPKEYLQGDFSQNAKIFGHEGRHRMKSILNVFGDTPIEVHIVFDSFLRSRHITPEIIDRLNMSITTEYGMDITGPFFRM